MKKQMELDEIIRDLKLGKVVTVPTETVEGYAVDANNEAAVQELMRIKERPVGSGKVFTLVPESVDAIEKYVVVSKVARGLIDKYIPGELTLILPKRASFRHFYYDAVEAIGVRIPDHPYFGRILTEVGALMLTSANPRGGVPKSLTGHKPSTIVDCTGAQPMVVRQGEITVDF